MRKLCLFIFIAFTGCYSPLEIEGFWVGCDEYGDLNGKVMELSEDTIYLFSEFQMPLKSTYKLRRNKIILRDKFQMFSNEFMGSGGAIPFKQIGDTIVLDSGTPDKYIRSPYNSLVDHYANSKGLRISLPSSSIPFPNSFDNYECLDLFIGYDKNGSVQLGVNDVYLDSLDQLKQWINVAKDAMHTKFILRVFADKFIPNQYLVEVREAMILCKLRKVQYVTKSTSRLLRNRDVNPYINRFYGIPMLVPPYKIIFISE